MKAPFVVLDCTKISDKNQILAAIREAIDKYNVNAFCIDPNVLQQSESLTGTFYKKSAGGELTKLEYSTASTMEDSLKTNIMVTDDDMENFRNSISAVLSSTTSCILVPPHMLKDAKSTLKCLGFSLANNQNVATTDSETANISDVNMDAETNTVPSMFKNAICYGGGVIGGAWAARFALNGVNVTICDPDPESKRKINEVMNNAWRANEKLYFDTGKYTALSKKAQYCRDNIQYINPLSKDEDEQKRLQEALAKADFIQEALPENVAIKSSAYAVMEKYCSDKVIIASSTSGILPGDLSKNMTHANRLIIAHPFNPVYLLPLVELCGQDQDVLQTAFQFYKFLGMHPLLLSKKASQTPGFVADRLLEAIWREGLHLINEGVATASELDQCITYGPGLRWSCMGTNMLYRLAGGERGMRHFMSQFGPCLKWPWTKLIAPELSDELLDKIVMQSDSQATEMASDDMTSFTKDAGKQIREFEVLRDDCIVSTILGLKKNNFASGAVLESYEQVLVRRETKESLTSMDFELHFN